MKKSLLFSFLLLAAACTIEKPELDASETDSEATVFHAAFADDLSKTYVDENLHLFWHADDRVSIFSSTYNQQYAFKGKTGDNGGAFKKITTDEFVTGSRISRNYAVYPYNEDNKINYDESLSIVLPRDQKYAENSFGIGSNTMVAVTEDLDDHMLYFQNLCGYVVVRLYGDAKVTGVRLESNLKMSEYLSGKATVIAKYGEDPVVSFTDEDGMSCIYLDCGDGVEVGKTKETATEFWFAVAPLSFSEGFTVYATTSDATTFRKSTSKVYSVERNVVHKLEPFEVHNVEHEAVDLGLSVKWATFNLGATGVYDSGNHYPYGETDLKSYYTRETYKWYKDGNYCLKYNSDASSGIADMKTRLDAEDDAAYVKWGGDWRMPTRAELYELRTKCDWQWTEENGVCGYVLTSKVEGFTDKSIFLPAAGVSASDRAVLSENTYGDYRSSSLSASYYGYHLFFYNNNQISEVNSGYSRHLGASVRPVLDDVIEISMSDQLLYLMPGQTWQLGIESDSYRKLNVVWASEDNEVVSVGESGKVTAKSEGRAVVTACLAGDNLAKVTCLVIVESDNSTKTVDLGTKMNWADRNINAKMPYDTGDYYAFGEIRTKSSYDWSNYIWCDGSETKLTKYVTDSNWGTVDGKSQLEAEDDIATVTLGENFMIPTIYELSNIRSCCNWEWVKANGVFGYKVISAQNPDNFIFLPAAGQMDGSTNGRINTYGDYYSSTVYNGKAYHIYFSSSFVSEGNSVIPRYHGNAVRAVSTK